MPKWLQVLVGVLVYVAILMLLTLVQFCALFGSIFLLLGIASVYRAYGGTFPWTRQ